MNSITQSLNMDSFVSKLRQTVSQVAYQVNSSVNTIIPGNAIHREYEMLKLRCTHGSPGFVWSVYDAVKRDSSSIKASLKDAIGPSISQIGSSAGAAAAKLSPQSSSIAEQPGDEAPKGTDKQLFSVFVFDKSQFDAISTKADRETALEHTRKGVLQLTRLRHPSVLTVHHPIEESRSSLAFVSEHVYGHLASILKEQRGRRVDSKAKKLASSNLVDLSQDLGPKDSDYQSDSCELDSVQIKAGLLQICDGLKFLHNDAKLLHRNLCLENIFVDSNNTWKIAGFDFSCHQSSSNGVSSVCPQPDKAATLQIVDFGSRQANSSQFPSLKTIYPALPTNIVPNWSCSAPEHSNSDQVAYASDVFSLGIMSCALLGQDLDMIDLSYEYGLMSDTYKRGILFRELADKLPAQMKTNIMKYAAINVDSRPSLDDYQNLAIFNDHQVQAIRDLDSQFTWDRLKKIDFFNRLRDLLPKLSHQVKVNRIAKTLFNEILNTEMMPYILPCVLIIAKDSTPSEFKTKIFPHLKGPFRVLEPRSVPTMLLDNLEMLADRAKLCLAEFQLMAFTLVQYLLRMDQQMQEKCFQVLPVVRRFLDNKSMSSIILPEFKRICSESPVLAVQVKCLESMGKLVDRMERTIVIQTVLPIVFEIPSRDASVIMAAVGVIKTIVNEARIDLTKDVVAGKILPFLFPLTIERDINLQQFDIILSLVKLLMDRVEREQRELLGRKHQVSNQRSNTLVLDNFKGSNHFQLN